MRKKVTYHTLDAERFVRIWQSSVTFREAVTRYGMLSSRAACAAANNLRRRGVPLKKFAPMGRAVRHDYKALANLAKESLKK